VPRSQKEQNNKTFPKCRLPPCHRDRRFLQQNLPITTNAWQHNKSRLFDHLEAHTGGSLGKHFGTQTVATVSDYDSRDACMVGQRSRSATCYANG
jgi:hypothetical protein